MVHIRISAASALAVKKVPGALASCKLLSGQTLGGDGGRRDLLHVPLRRAARTANRRSLKTEYLPHGHIRDH